LAVLLDQRLEGRNVAGATSLDEGGIVGFHVLWAAPRALRRLDARVAVLIVAGPGGSPACSRAGRGRTQAQERIETEQIALWAETRDLASCDGRDDRSAAKLLACVDVGEMHLDDRHVDRRHRVAQRDR